MENIEVQLSYLKGRIEGLSSLCAILIATHPKASNIIRIFNQRVTEISELEHPTDYLKAYADGFASTEMNIDEVLALFEHDELKIFEQPPH